MSGELELPYTGLSRGKRRGTYVVIFIISLLGGIEYAVILPTLYLHLKDTFHAPDYFLGITLSAFSFSGLFASPIMGRIYDKTRQSKLLILTTILLNIGGSIMYWLAVNEWYLIGSRLIAGLGVGFFPIMLAEISHSTSEKQRTSAVSALMAARQFGLLVGPACNLFLRTLNFYIGSFIVDKYSAPGLFMAALWVVVMVLHLIFFHTLAPLQKPVKITNNNDSEVNSANLTESLISNGSTDQGLTTTQALNGLLKEEYFAIFMLTAVLLFNQSGVEALVTPLTNKVLSWGELEVSYLYLGVGVLILVSFASVHFCSKRFEDRSLMLFGLILQIISLAMLVTIPIMLKNPASHYTLSEGIFLTSVVICVYGLPFVFVCHISLFSKLLQNNIQGLGQGVRRTVAGCGTILGPLWCTSLLDSGYIMSGVMLGINFFSLALLLLSYKKLKPPAEMRTESVSEKEPYHIQNADQPITVQHESQYSSTTASSPTEKTPLL